MDIPVRHDVRPESFLAEASCVIRALAHKRMTAAPRVVAIERLVG